MDNKQKLQGIKKKYKIEYIKVAFIVFTFVVIFLCYIFPFNIEQIYKHIFQKY